MTVVKLSLGGGGNYLIENKFYCTKKMKFSIKDFSSKCNQIRRKLRICSHLLKKTLMENFVFLVQCSGSSRQMARVLSIICGDFFYRTKLTCMKFFERLQRSIIFTSVISFSYLFPVKHLRWKYFRKKGSANASKKCE